MTTALWIAATVAGVVVYSVCIGVAYDLNLWRTPHDEDRWFFSAVWPFFAFVLVVHWALTFVPLQTVRYLDRRAERKRLPEARVIKP